MKLKLSIWRQKNQHTEGKFVDYPLDNVSEHMSFLEMLDVLNAKLEADGHDPVAFDHDCREGICGACSMMINGQAHGPWERTTTCQLHMRAFKDGDTIVIEPWRAKGFPPIKDLVVDRSAFDRIIESGGFVSINAGAAQDANAILVPKDRAEKAMDAAECIGCGACVAACPNSSAMLFTAAKVAHLAQLPQGQPERYSRVQKMVEQQDQELFGSCTNYGECQDACPKGISITYIANLNRDYLRAPLEETDRSRDPVKAQ